MAKKQGLSPSSLFGIFIQKGGTTLGIKEVSDITIAAATNMVNDAKYNVAKTLSIEKDG